MRALAPSIERPIGDSERCIASPATAKPRGTTLSVWRTGYLVPATDFDGHIHSLFARACNIACGATLLTVVAEGLADGPTTLKLAKGGADDLRSLFHAGERLRCRNKIASTKRVELHLAGAETWRPAPVPAATCSEQVAVNLRWASVALAHRRRTHSSVIDRNATAIVAGLGAATRRLDPAATSAGLDRLIGWGEGLTPAGDDVVVGWLAALDALAGADGGRIRFLRALSEAVAARTPRTVPIAAHCLWLAAHGHFNADVSHLRNTLLGDDAREAVEAALHDALDAGATSGADMVTGMIAGIEAWTKADTGCARSRIARAGHEGLRA